MIKTYLALALLSVASTSAVAQEALGLLEIYERALLNDPQIREAEANFLATSEIKRQARSALLPSLSLNSTYTDSSTTNDSPQSFNTGQPIGIQTIWSDSETQNLSLTLNQTIYNRGQFLTSRRADKTIERAEVDLATTQQNLMVRVTQAYFSVLAAEDLLAADLAAREALGQQLEQTRRRFDVGLIAITDVQEAQAGYDQSVASVIASERSLATAQESLREIVNEYVTDLRSPIEELPLLSPDPDDVDAWVEVAQAQNLALVASRISADIAEDEIEIARSTRYPTLSLSAQGSDRATTSTTDLFGVCDFTRPGENVFCPGSPQSSASDGANFQLILSLPIFNGGSIRSRVQESVYRRRAALESVERIARQTERETRDAYLGVTSEISRVQALRQALESSRTALLATQAGEEVGQRTTVDVVNAQNNVRRAETTHAAARYEYLLNILRLKLAAGSLSGADLAEIDSLLE